MSKKDLFRMLIKIAGLYFIIVFFGQLSSTFPLIFLNGGDWRGDDIIIILSFVLIVFILLSIVVLLITKPDVIINLFRLDKGYDTDKIDLGNAKSVSAVSVIRLGIIVIGGWLFLENISPFLTNCYYVFKDHVSSNNILPVSMFNEWDYYHWVVSALNVVIGLLLLFNSYSVARFLWKREEGIETED